MTSTERLINESLDQINSETWRKTCEHVEKIENEYLKYFNLDFQLIINLQDDYDTSESDFECSSDSD